jgi:hypothetical protein
MSSHEDVFDDILVVARVIYETLPDMPAASRQPPAASSQQTAASSQQSAASSKQPVASS